METLIRWLGQLATHPELRELYYRDVHDFDTLEGADLVGFGVLMNQLFHIFNEMYDQRLEGHLNPRVWRKVEGPLRDIIAYPGVQAWWRTRSHRFNKEFVMFVDQLQQTAKPSRTFGELMKDE